MATRGLSQTKMATRWARKDHNAKFPKPEDLVRKWNILRGDLVQIIKGKDEGKQGIVEKVLRRKNAVIVKNLNLVKKRSAPTEESKSRLVQQEAPVPYSCVALVDPKTKQPCRVRWEKVADGVATGGFNGKIRVSKASGEVIARPPVLSVPRKVTQVTENETPAAEAHKATFSALDLLAFPAASSPKASRQ